MDNTTETSTIAAIFWILVPITFFIIAIIKRKKQVGRIWDGPLSARVKISDIQLTCQLCKEDHFYKREALIGSTLVTLFGYHFLNQSGAAYTCTKCGHVHWFSRPKETAIEFFHDKE